MKVEVAAASLLCRRPVQSPDRRRALRERWLGWWRDTVNDEGQGMSEITDLSYRKADPCRDI